jgi:hypothetical protein
MSKNNELLFNESLKLSEPSEKLIYDIIKPHVDSIIKNNDYRFDFLIKKDGKEIKIEVKFDDVFLTTRNFAVEFECRGKPSGIKTSESDFWVFVDSNNNIYCINASILKELCKISETRTAKCKDGINKIYTVKEKVFLPNRIDLLDILK